MRHTKTIAALLFAASSGMLVAPATARAEMRQYIIIAQSSELPSDLPATVTMAGGMLDDELAQVGMAFASADTPDFAQLVSSHPQVRSVIEDLDVPWIDDSNLTVELMGVDEAMADPGAESVGAENSLFRYQWGLRAIGAQAAWAAGQRGGGVRVAVLDSGIDAENPDISPNLNRALCASFVPGEHWNIRPGRYFNHGTHVAGIIAAADNHVGIVGVAPQAEIVAIKVLSEYTGSGSFANIIKGIVYAADIDADIINMSLGSYFARHIYGPDSAERLVAYSRATTYAHLKGVTIIASGGNSSIDLNHDADGLRLPGDAAHVITISATGPVGVLANPSTNLDPLASYSNYGQAGIDFAAPGGDNRLYPSSGWQYDMVLSPGSEAWYFSAGTSMAAPHASGVAALIIGANGGSMHPDQVAAKLGRAADDLGKAGADDFYGAGRVSAANLVP